MSSPLTPASLMTPSIRLFAALSLMAAAGAAAEAPTVSDAWIRATPPGARAGAAYLTMTSVAEADRLVGVSTAVAEAVEIHTHVVEDGLQRMVHLADLKLPAGEAVRLEPGGLHLMLIDLRRPLVAGTTVHLSLRFATAGVVELDVPVLDARAGAPPPHAEH